MKTILFFVILTFSITAIGQNHPVGIHPAAAKSKISHTTLIANHEAFLHSTGKPSDMDFAKEIERQSRELFTLIQVYDSIYTWQWDSFATKWILASKFIDITYNADNYPTSYVGQNFDGSVWTNSIKYEFTYDGNNNQTGLTYKGWNGTSFQNIFRDVYTYDANNNQTSYLFQTWSGTAWVNSSQYIYMYDGSHNQTSQLEQEWNGTSWDNYSLITSMYDANNNLISDVGQNWNDLNGTWDNATRNLHTYDANNNQLTFKYQSWNETIVDWDDSGLNTYTYDANNNLISELFQYWDGMTWVNYSKYINTYDSNNNQTNSLLQYWNVSNWDNSARTTNSYNANNQLLRSLNENWTGSWVYSALAFNTYGENDFRESYSNRSYNIDGVIVTNGDSTFNFFHTVTGTHDVTTDNANIIVSPNPNNGLFTISSKDGLQSINIYNLIGDRIYSLDQAKGQTSVGINLAGYGNGIYIMTMTDGKKTYSRKVVVQ